MLLLQLGRRVEVERARLALPTDTLTPQAARAGNIRHPLKTTLKAISFVSYLSGIDDLAVKMNTTVSLLYSQTFSGLRLWKESLSVSSCLGICRISQILQLNTFSLPEFPSACSPSRVQPIAIQL